MKAKKTLTCFTTILNEEPFLQTYLDGALKYADQILIVDGGSIDHSIEIIKRYQKKFPIIELFIKPQKGMPYTNDWNKGERYNFMLDRAIGDWVLKLDADEILGDNFKDRAQDLMQCPENLYGFKMISFWKDLQHVRVDHPNDKAWSNFIYRMWRNDVKFRFTLESHHSICPGVTKLNKVQLPDVKWFHLHYLRVKDNDNRRGDLGLSTEDISEGKSPDWEHINKKKHRYSILIEPYFEDYPEAIREHFEYKIAHLSDKIKYQEHYNDALAKFNNNTLTEEYERIKKHLPFIKGKVLELGCESGGMTKIISKYANHVTAIDVSGRQIEKAKINCKEFDNIKYLESFAEDIDYRGEFDSVVLHEILEHVMDDELVLRKAYEAAKVGGYILVSIPLGGIWVDSGHVRHYDSAKLKKLIDKTMPHANCVIEDAGINLLVTIRKI